jgi:hypothetical protein
LWPIGSSKTEEKEEGENKMKNREQIILFLALFVSVSAQSCDNPVFQNPSSWGANSVINLNSLPLASLPVPSFEEPTACKEFSKEAGAELTCCTNETIAHIAAAFSVAQKAMNVAEAAIANNAFVDELVGLLDGVVNITCFFAHCPPGVRVTIQKYIAILAEASKEVAVSQVKCASGMLAYTEGMICFACEVNWAKFLDNETKVIRLAQNTCDSVYKSCDPVFNAAMNVAIQAQNFAKELVKVPCLRSKKYN